MKNNAYFILLFIFTLGCNSLNNLNKQSWLQDFDNWRHKSNGESYAIQKVDHPIRKHDPSLRFEVRDSDEWINENNNTYKKGKNGSHRAEISTEITTPMGDESWYGFSLFIPESFPIEKNRLVLAQWWGETFSNDPVVRSPPLALRFMNGRLFMDLRFLHREPKEIFSADNFTIERWHDFVLFVRWSSQEGEIRLWINKREVAYYRGPIGDHGITGITPVFGIYRDNSQKTYICYFSECRQGKSFDEVDPSSDQR